MNLYFISIFWLVLLFLLMRSRRELWTRCCLPPPGNYVKQKLESQALQFLKFLHKTGMVVEREKFLCVRFLIVPRLVLSKNAGACASLLKVAARLPHRSSH